MFTSGRDKNKNSGERNFEEWNFARFTNEPIFLHVRLRIAINNVFLVSMLYLKYLLDSLYFSTNYIHRINNTVRVSHFKTYNAYITFYLHFLSTFIYSVYFEKYKFQENNNRFEDGARTKYKHEKRQEVASKKNKSIQREHSWKNDVLKTRQERTMQFTVW